MSTKIIQINVAEAIIEPFFDRQLNNLKDWVVNKGLISSTKKDNVSDQWWETQPESIYVYNDGYKVDASNEYGIKLYQIWCRVNFEWAKKPNIGPVISVSKSFDIDCSEYTHLVVSLSAPCNSIITYKAETDIGEIVFSFEPFYGKIRELPMDLKGAKHIGRITIDIKAENEGEGAGYFNWIGLQNVQLLNKYLKQWERFNENWEPYLKPVSYEPDFEPKYGLLINKDEVENLRSTYNKIIADDNKVSFIENAYDALKIAPEKRIHEYVGMWDDFQFCRERDCEKVLITRPINGDDFSMGVNAALTGILLKDKELLRLSARFALSIAFCTNWTDGFVNKMPGSNFEVKAFVASLCTQELSLILDLAWDYFTVIGRQYIMRRIAEEGISNINWMIWKHAEKPEEIFKMNQLIWFTPARILGYTLLEKEWKHLVPYTELAYKELLESIDCIFSANGGYTEGPSYFSFVCKEAMKAIYYYWNTKGTKNVSLPDSFERTKNYIEAFYSVDDERDIISVGDCGYAGRSMLETMAIMAAEMPESVWVRMFWKAYNRTNCNRYGFFIQKYYSIIPKKMPELRNFIFLHDTGIMTSTRKFEGEYVKIFINGNKANAGHNHSDKGSFVLEFAGDTFAMDPGITTYGVELHTFLIGCSRHNMLVPVGLGAIPNPLYPIPYDVKPDGFGNEKIFQAEMDLTPGWEEYYDKWTRKWCSPEPNLFIIKDEYKIKDGDGVEFYWNTILDVNIENRNIEIIGKRGRIVIEVPEDCSIRLDLLPYLEDIKQKRISICKKGMEGQLEIKVVLYNISLI